MTDQLWPRLRSVGRWVSQRRRELTLAGAAALVGLLALEIGGRWHEARIRRLPFLHDAEQRFYPRLHHGLRGYRPGATNVLLLGGSTLERIRAPLWNAQHPGWRFHNVSLKAHTSLDSRYKYEYLLRKGFRFDFVVFYHGINDTRTNNVPPALFDPNYGHYAFYRMAHTIFRDRGSLRSLVVRSSYLGYSLELLYRLRPAQEGMLPPGPPPKEWKPFGAEIKSREPFRRNLVRISELARAAGSRLVVPLFAYYHPEDYSFEAWTRREVGRRCGNPGDPPHIWGYPPNVVRGIREHNRAIEEERSRFILVDTADISGVAEHFCDICHFSTAGAELFVEKVLGAIEKPR